MGLEEEKRLEERDITTSINRSSLSEEVEVISNSDDLKKKQTQGTFRRRQINEKKSGVHKNY